MIHLDADDLWVMATAACCAMACGLLGCFLVLQRLSLLGDAISHAILPGIAAAFIVTGSRASGGMLVGAAVAGLVTAFLAAAIRRIGRVPEDAALGVVFTSLFALGVVMITWVAGSIDLDPGCVLYGLIEFVPDDRVELPWPLAGVAVPRAFAWLAGALVVAVVFVSLLLKELRLVAFDASLATAMGFSAAALHSVFLGVTTATIVLSFEAVGSILVVAMLVAPGATARLLVDRLGAMLLVAALAGLASAVGGYLLALCMDTSVAGAMSVVAGGLFAAALLLSPRHGAVARLLQRWALTLRIRGEDILGELHRAGEPRPSPPSAIAEPPPEMPRWERSLATRLLLLRGLATRSAAGLALTPRGAERAEELVRHHRRWERYLLRETELPLDHLHEPAHRVEHFIAGDLARRLEAEVPDASDPHRPGATERNPD
ncbi:MAG TPA: metal ABC transporter permease [Phycisphaerales bacterium]|nr:metal ABC transporter permease [Phycisphaerales bacterium]HMP38463.1 metal ABC transporter permease [Phycisphaerales bacterium]